MIKRTYLAFLITLRGRGVHGLLGRHVSMGREHGTVHECTFAGVSFKLFVSYHPAAALYGAEAKQRLHADFKKIGQFLKTMG
jgi:uracil-DNA glycosylase family 4